MPEHQRISDVQLQRGSQQDLESGLEGYVSFNWSGVRIDGVTLRRTRRGHPALSFPCRTDRNGHEHPYIRPLSADVRKRIELEVFDALGITEDTP